MEQNAIRYLLLSIIIIIACIVTNPASAAPDKVSSADIPKYCPPFYPKGLGSRRTAAQLWFVAFDNLQNIICRYDNGNVVKYTGSPLSNFTGKPSAGWFLGEISECHGEDLDSPKIISSLCAFY